jgi:hypothetical protein
VGYYSFPQQLLYPTGFHGIAQMQDTRPCQFGNLGRMSAYGAIWSIILGFGNSQATPRNRSFSGDELSIPRFACIPGTAGSEIAISSFKALLSR